MKNFKQFSEKMDIKKTEMGDVIKDFQASDAPQFAGKSKEKRRQMAIAAKMQAEGTIQPNGTDKMEVGCDDVATKKKTDKEMKDQQNESWTFDSAAMAKQELADAKNKQHRKRGKVANLLRKLGMKEDVSLDEGVDPSEVAGAPNMYSADTVKKAYYHKKASDSDKKSLERHLDRHHGNKEWRKPVKEEAEQIDEVNHREYASAGKMHPTMAQHMRSGSECDFYHSSTGDKLSGIVKHKTDKEVHIKANKDGKMGAGEMHKFSISEELIDELSRDTLLSYANKVSLDSQKHSKDPSKRSGEKASRSITGYARAHNRLEKPVKEEAEGNQMQEELKGGQVNLDKNHNNKLDKQDFKLLRKKLKESKMGKPVNVDKVQTAGQEPHEEKWEDTKKKQVKKESYTVDQLLMALKEGMWPGTPEYTAKFGNQAKQGGGAGVKKGSRYGGSLQKPEKEDDNDADDKPAKKPKNK